jgi:hypothetical protein
MEENIKQFFKKTDALKKAIIVFLGLALVIFIFGVGVFVGETKARFSFRWAENYHNNFAGPKGGFLGDWQRLPMPPDNFMESRGIFGEIIKINGDLVIRGKDNMERVVILSASTLIERGRESIKKEDLKIGDKIVVIGSPNEQGQIEAKLVRIF